MGVLSSIFLFPLAPVRGVIWLGEVIQEQVEQQLHDPAAVRREIEEIDEATASGRLTEQEQKRARQAALDRIVRPPSGMPPTDEKE